MPRLAVVDPAPVEIPELRAAYAAETSAVARIGDLKQRLAEARSAADAAQRDCDALAGRVAGGEALTGADVRRAAQALDDAEATVILLTKALPEAGQQAKAAARARSAAERAVQADAARPFEAALEAAERALAEAQDAHRRALADTKRLPDRAAAELGDLLDRHGRDEEAARFVAELVRLEFANAQRKLAGMPLVGWP